MGTPGNAFLFCDLVGSTELLSRLGNEASERVRRRYFAVLREAIEITGGDEVKNLGDGLMVAFMDGAGPAIACAVGMQRGIARLNVVHPDQPISLRIGVAEGEGTLAAEEGDWYGTAVNTAARLCGRAAGSQILVASAEEVVAGAVPVGLLELKGLPDPVAAVAVSWSGDRPDVWPLAFAVPETEPFVDRRAELARLEGLTAGDPPEVPVVVVSGDPGVGKTRLARRFAEDACGAGRLSAVWYGRCRLDATSPYEPLADALRWWMSSRPSSLLGRPPGGRARAIDTLAAVASSRPPPLSPAPLVEPAAPAEPRAVADALRFLASEARPGGRVLLVVDDLHHAAGPLVDVLADVAQSVDGRLALLGLLREDGPTWATTVDRLRGERLRLGGLGSVHVAELLGPSGSDSVEAVTRRTGGNPRAVLDARRALAAAGWPPTDRADTIVDHLCPYRGLAPFRSVDHTLFFGRNQLVAEVVEQLRRCRLLGVLGPSGSGKSSLVLAGVIPALAAGVLPRSDRWAVAAFEPGASPFNALATALARRAGSTSPIVWEEELIGRAGALEAIARELVPDPDGRLVLVADQFEELFTHTVEPAVRSAFIDALVTTTALPGGRVSLLIAMRADFYGNLADFPGLAAALRCSHVLVGPMSTAELRDAVVQPAFVAGLRLEEGLVDRVVRDVAGQAGALPLLSHALRETWRRRNGQALNLGGYRDAGGVQGSVARSADAIADGLGDEERLQLQRLLLRLVALGEGTEDTRRRVELAELPPAQRALVPMLVDARLLATDDGTVEVAHEALIRQWPRLRGWLDDDRDGLRLHRHLTEAAAGWERSGRDPGELYRGGRLQAALDWTASHRGDLNVAEAEFLDASVHLRDEERRRQSDQLAAAERTTRRLRRLLVSVAAFAALTVLAAVVAVVQRRAAIDARDGASRSQFAAEQAAADADAARRQSDLRRLVAESKVAQGKDLALALLLAAEAHRLDPGAASRGALQSALVSNPRLLGFLRIEGRIPYADLSADGSTLVFGRDDGRVELWDTASQRRIGEPWVVAEGGNVRPVLARDGQTLATSDIAGNVDLWDLRTRQRRFRAATAEADPGTGNRPAPLGFAADGSRLFVPLRGGRVVAVATAAGQAGAAPVELVGGLASAVNELAVSPDGSRLALHTIDFRVVVVDTTSGAEQLSFATGIVAPVARSIAWSPDGRRIAVGEGGTVGPLGAVFDAATGQRAGPYFTEASSPWVGFTADGRMLVHRLLPGHARVSGPGHRGAPRRADTTVHRHQQRRAEQPQGRSSLRGRSERHRGHRGHGRLVQARSSPPRPRPSDHAGRRSSGAMAAAVTPGGVEIIDAAGRAVRQLAWPADALPTGPFLRLAARPVAFSPDLTRVAVGGVGGRVDVYDLGDGSLLKRVPIPFAPPDSKFFASYDSSAQRWVGTVVWSPDGKTIAAGQWDRVYLLDAESGVVRGQVGGLRDFLTMVSFSPDARLLAVGSFDGTGKIVDPSTGEMIGPPLGRGTFDGGAGAWSPDGRSFAVVNWAAKDVRILDVATRQVTKPIIGNLTGNAGVTWFTRDGRTLVLSVSDGWVRMFDVDSGLEIGDGFPDRSQAPMAQPVDGQRTMLLAGTGSAAMMWDIDPESWIRKACDVAGRNLTRAEWDRYRSAAEPHRATCPQWPVREG